jgi:thiol-disulfide isomerase/thioredoxin
MRKFILTASMILFSVSAGAQSSQQAPPLTLKDIHGRQFRLSDYKGKVVLLNFWATWCPPCRTEVPDLIKMQTQYRDRGLRIIGITQPPEKFSEVRRFMRKLGVNYRVVLGTKTSKVLFTSSDTLPMTVVIDREGAVRDAVEGILYSDEFDQRVKPLLSSKIDPSSAKPRRAKPAATHIQRSTIVVNVHGYQPSSVRLRTGIPARLTFIRKVEQTCGREIVIPGYGINRPLPLNVPVVAAFTPRKTGRFKFTCGMDMFRGSLVVR